VRKASVLPAVIAIALLSLGSSSALAARPRGHGSKSTAAHKAASRRHKQKHKAVAGKRRSGIRVSSGRKKLHPRIYQDISGKIVLERLSTPPFYGPFLPVEVQDYPRPPCEPVDAVAEVRIHEPEWDPEAPETPEELSKEGVVKEGVARAVASLSGVAKKLGSLFSPKSSQAVVKPEDVDLTELVSQAFQIPVEGVDAAKLTDSFLSSRGRHHQHLAIDIGAPRGTPIVATTDGEIVRIARERRGGKAIYQKDETGRYLLFYCHLSGYAADLSVAKKVRKGEVIGYVGATGHVVGGPHLHFSITRLPDDASSFKRGLAINPYLLFLAGVR
jgi:peptidoglycan LD-endopeptidase LytH